MLVTTSLTALAAGEKVELSPGDTLRVSYSFNYRVAEDTSVQLWASLYQRTLGVINRVEQAQAKQTIRLDMSLTWKPYEGSVDILIGQVNAGTYGLIVEIPETDVKASVDDAVVVVGAPGIMDLLPLLIVVMMMGMMTDVMEGV